MTISSQDSRKSYAGNDATTVFNAPRVFDADHLIATLVEDSTGAITELVITTDYTLDDIGEDITEFTMLTAPATGYTLVIRREVPIVQSTDVKNQGAFFPEIHEDQFDYRCMVEQQLADALSRAVLQPADGGFNYDFQQHRGINVSDPVGSQDIVNYRTLQAAIDSAADFGTPRVPLEFEFDGDGSAVTFSCPGIAGNDSALVYIVTIDGVVQNPINDYTVNDVDETVTFTTAPPDETDVNIRLFGYARTTLPESNTAGTWTFYRGDGNYANKLIESGGPLPNQPPVEAFSMFTVEANNNHTSIKIASAGYGSLMFSTDGGTDAYEMELGYNPSLEAIVWNAYGSTVFGQLFKTGDMSFGTYNSLYVDRGNIRVGIGGQTTPTEALDVTGNIVASGSISGDLDGGDVVSGIVAPTRLGTGIPSSSNFLRGDGTWSAGAGGGGGNTVNVRDTDTAEVAVDGLDFNEGASTLGARFELFIDNITSGRANIRGIIPVATVTADTMVSASAYTVFGNPMGSTSDIGREIVSTGDYDTLRRVAGGDIEFGLLNVLSIDATGTPDSTTVLFGDGTWGTPGSAGSSNQAIDEWTLYDSIETRDEFKIKKFTTSGGNTAIQFQQWSHAGAAWKDTLKLDWSSTGGGLGETSYITVPTTKNMWIGTTDGTGTVLIDCSTLNLAFIDVLTMPPNLIDHTYIAKGTAPFFLGSGGSGAQNASAMSAAVATSNLVAMVGDSGSGGAKGLVPAPAAGDAAASKYLRADGTWAVTTGGATFVDSSTIDFTVGGTVTAAVIAGSIGASHLANLAVTSGKLDTGAVTSTKIATGAVLNAAIGNTAVSLNKLSATGTPSTSTFLRGDFTWATPAGGASSIVFNVKDYGALGNGAANDYAAINLAYAAAVAAGGGTVYFPPGTYLTSNTLVFGSNIHIQGAGAHYPTGLFDGTVAATTIKWNGSTGGTVMSFPTAVYRAQVGNFKINGNTTAAIGIEVNNCEACRFHDISITNCRQLSTSIGFNIYSIGGIAHSIWERISVDWAYSEAVAGTGVSMKVWTSTDPNEDVTLCVFRDLELNHSNTGLYLGSSDNCTFYNINCYHVQPGTWRHDQPYDNNYDIVMDSQDSIVGFCAEHYFYRVVGSMRALTTVSSGRGPRAIVYDYHVGDGIYPPRVDAPYTGESWIQWRAANPVWNGTSNVWHSIPHMTHGEHLTYGPGVAVSETLRDATTVTARPGAIISRGWDHSAFLANTGTPWEVIQNPDCGGAPMTPKKVSTVSISGSNVLRLT